MLRGQRQGYFRVRRDPGTIAKVKGRTTSTVSRLYGQVERLRRAIQVPPLELWAMWSDPEPMLLVVRGLRNSNSATEKVGVEKGSIGIGLTIIHFRFSLRLPR